MDRQKSRGLSQPALVVEGRCESFSLAQRY
jgi:hypothetical protein